MSTEDRDRADRRTPEQVSLARPLTSRGRLGRRLLKRFMYSQMALRQGLMIILGREHPLLRFTVESDPPSIYYVFRLRSEAIAGLGRRLGLPAHFDSTPLRCLATDEPAHLLTLNVYRVSGLASGLRAEWSIYVADHAGKARYMVVDARSSKGSMDPVSVITRSSRVVHERTADTVFTSIGDGDNKFEATLQLPAGAAGEVVASAAEWVTANDYIYWGNGICDRTFYDAGLAAANQIDVSATAAKIADRSPWSQLVHPEPVHILVFRDAIEFVVSPWENIDRLQV
jgi:hypothetical protein